MPVPLLSVVIPVYNEKALVDTLVARCVAALATVSPGFEIICVDDGSRDQTLARLLAACHAEPRLKVLCLSRNFDHRTPTPPACTPPRASTWP